MGEVEEKKAKMAEAVAKRPEMIRPPMHVMVARKAYINAVKQRVIPQIKNYMIAVNDEKGETKMQPAIPTECKAWSSLAGHKRKATGQCASRASTAPATVNCYRVWQYDGE